MFEVLIWLLAVVGRRFLTQSCAVTGAQLYPFSCNDVDRIYLAWWGVVLAQLCLGRFPRRLLSDWRGEGAVGKTITGRVTLALCGFARIRYVVALR